MESGSFTPLPFGVLDASVDELFPGGSTVTPMHLREAWSSQDWSTIVCELLEDAFDEQLRQALRLMHSSMIDTLELRRLRKSGGRQRALATFCGWLVGSPIRSLILIDMRLEDEEVELFEQALSAHEGLTHLRLVLGAGPPGRLAFCLLPGVAPALRSLEVSMESTQPWLDFAQALHAAQRQGRTASLKRLALTFRHVPQAQIDPAHAEAGDLLARFCAAQPLETLSLMAGPGSAWIVEPVLRAVVDHAFLGSLSWSHPWVPVPQLAQALLDVVSGARSLRHLSLTSVLPAHADFRALGRAMARLEQLEVSSDSLKRIEARHCFLEGLSESTALTDLKLMPLALDEASTSWLCKLISRCRITRLVTVAPEGQAQQIVEAAARLEDLRVLSIDAFWHTLDLACLEGKQSLRSLSLMNVGGLGRDSIVHLCRLVAGPHARLKHLKINAGLDGAAIVAIGQAVVGPARLTHLDLRGNVGTPSDWREFVTLLGSNHGLQSLKVGNCLMFPGAMHALRTNSTLVEFDDRDRTWLNPDLEARELLRRNRLLCSARETVRVLQLLRRFAHRVFATPDPGQSLFEAFTEIVEVDADDAQFAGSGAGPRPRQRIRSVAHFEALQALELALQPPPGSSILLRTPGVDQPK